MKYDVVVVGGGPAGSVTARFAAESGAKVLIVERRPEIGVPVFCGEGTSKRVVNLGIMEKGRWIVNEANGARLFTPDGTMVKLSDEVAGAETGYVIDRDLFDKELAGSAARAGVEIQLKMEAIDLLKEKEKIKGVKVKHFDEELTIEADIVVGADGVESRVGKWAGINTTLKPKDIVTCAEYTLTNVECETDYCDFYLGNIFAPGGYIWVFPKRKDIANVGIGISAHLSEPGLASRLLDRFIASHSEYAKGQPIRMRSGAAPVSIPIESVRDNLLLVGDAARHTDPLTAGGIVHSLIGGKIAGEVIGEAVNKQKFDKETLSAYESGWKKAFGKKMRRNYIVKEVILSFDDKTLNKLADSLKDYKFEEFSTLSLVKALVLKHPMLLMKLKPLIKIADV